MLSFCRAPVHSVSLMTAYQLYEGRKISQSFSYNNQITAEGLYIGKLTGNQHVQ